jgi:hypothetical protein
MRAEARSVSLFILSAYYRAGHTDVGVGITRDDCISCLLLVERLSEPLPLLP